MLANGLSDSVVIILKVFKIKAELLVGRSSVLRMCSVNIFICTVTTGEMELLLIVQKSEGKWHHLPNYCLPTEQA